VDIARFVPMHFQKDCQNLVGNRGSLLDTSGMPWLFVIRGRSGRQELHYEQSPTVYKQRASALVIDKNVIKLYDWTPIMDSNIVYYKKATANCSADCTNTCPCSTTRTTLYPPFNRFRLEKSINQGNI
jgi:hypothetical protein